MKYEIDLHDPKMVIIYSKANEWLRECYWLEYVQQMGSVCQEQILFYRSKQSYMKISRLKPTCSMPMTNNI